LRASTPAHQLLLEVVWLEGDNVLLNRISWPSRYPYQWRCDLHCGEVFCITWKESTSSLFASLILRLIWKKNLKNLKNIVKK